MKKSIIPVILFLLLISASVPEKEKTYCNPMNLNYRFQFTNTVSYREAADPVVKIYRDKYFLFASPSGGYWFSDNLYDWNFIPVKTLPIEDYAPDVITIGDTTYFIASASVVKPVYYTTDPFRDEWKQLGKPLPYPVWDPHFFRDDDGKLFLYWGCSNNDDQPIRGVRLDSQMQPAGEPVVLIKHNPDKYGWENPGERNETNRNGYNEGAWMTKYNGRYYLQYASPGTEFKTYADGVYTADSPLGPFKFEPYSPFSYKPGGFIAGAGHSSTFADKYGNYWHIATMSISKRHMFERRLGLFPAFFDRDGVLRTFTTFGDYPTVIPGRKIDFDRESLFRGWMLQSYGKKATASSSADKFPPSNAFDEEVRTWWSAKTGDPGEWLCVDLGVRTRVNAVQVNFADNDAGLKPESRNIYYRYRVLASDDQKSWKEIVDRSTNTTDACHDYIELEKPVTTRYIRIENVKVPDGKFSVYDLRIFGLKPGKKPGVVTDFTIDRKSSDKRQATVTWTGDGLASGFVVNYGIAPGKLYSSVMVYDKDSLTLTGLNRDVTYYFSIDAFNGSGISAGTKTVSR